MTNNNPYDDPYEGLDNWNDNNVGQGGKGISHGGRPQDNTPGKPDKGEGGGGGGNVTAGDRGDVVGGGKGGDGQTSAANYVSSGGGGTSGGSAAYAAPTRFDRLASEAEGLYYQLWGEFPPPGYTEALVKKGMNIFEIEDHERRKPAFTRTDTYQNEYMAYAKMLAGLMGTR